MGAAIIENDLLQGNDCSLSLQAPQLLFCILQGVASKYLGGNQLSKELLPWRYRKRKKKLPKMIRCFKANESNFFFLKPFG